MESAFKMPELLGQLFTAPGRAYSSYLSTLQLFPGWAGVEGSLVVGVPRGLLLKTRRPWGWLAAAAWPHPRSLSFLGLCHRDDRKAQSLLLCPALSPGPRRISGGRLAQLGQAPQVHFKAVK